ncbi:aminopeptidase N [Bdellovibrio sp. HCB337]|uniref:aminopeptidase N n=1 Tax=Bdellovibrio sp. HCB337 TaxID=3394358 RepID=UPI0039A6955B
MTTKQSQKIYLKDYTKPHFEILSTQLDFNLNEDFCRVVATSKIKTVKGGSSLHLDGTDLELVSVSINNEKLNPSQYTVTAESLEIAHVPESFELRIETRLYPQNNTSLEGLYKSRDIFCTQCEAQGFRKITYFLDRPDVMTKYSVTIEADKKKYPVLLSNGDRIKVEDVGNGRHKATWNDPHKKPCYLFALVAGDLGVIRDHFTTKSGRKVNLEVYAAHGKQERCWHAMESLKKSMKWDEDTFGLEYDLNDYMIVAIDDFNAGAMENKGLNVFNSRLVLADSTSATDGDFHAIESVVAHEYFHNWTGNRVTVSNWFQLSLKEGLTVFRDQEFSADMSSRSVQRIIDVDSLRERQFPEDAGPNSHPVRPESCMAVDNFFTATIYEKGAEVIRMMQTIVGRKGFRKGMDEYFRRHDGQAVTTEDFAAAIAEPNKKDFSQFKLWYHQSGTPEVIVSEKYDAHAKEFHLTLAQSCAPTPGQTDKKPFHIPLLLGLLNSKGQEMELHCEHVTRNSDGRTLIELCEEVRTYTFKLVPERPVLSILRDLSAPVNLKWDAKVEDLYFLMEKDTDEFNRREAAQKVILGLFSKLIGHHRQSKPLEVDASFIAAIGKVLHDENISESFKAQMLQLPSDVVLAQQEDLLDAPAFFAARKAIRHALAIAHKQKFTEIYNKYHDVEPLSRDPKVFGHRLYKNIALSFLQELDDPSMTEIVVQQYQTAKNMTDQLVAMELLASSGSHYRQQALEDFHQKWHTDSVVLNKWFTAQAFSSRRDTFDVVKSLTEHPSFNINNPNNVYALLRSFTQNYAIFHSPDHPAYEFLADMILKIDEKNPQVAARLCAAFNFVKKFPPHMKDKALSQIRRVVSHEKLSKNSRELLQSAL